MENRICKIKWLLCAMALVPALCFAEEPFHAKGEIAFHSGYANMPGGTGGLTSPAGSYERKLCSGITWDGRYYRHLKHGVSAGALYSGFMSKGAHAGGSHRLYIHYFNNSKVYGKERRVTGGWAGGNAGLQATCLLHPHWGVSAEAGYIASAVKKVDITYHNETIRVEYPFMKKKLFLLFFMLLAASCEDKTIDITVLPEETTHGACTFGCLIDGWVYVGGRYAGIISGRFWGGSIAEGRFDVYYTALQPCAASFTSPPSRPVI
ncbi:MAG: hypothetical protein LBF62_01875 [Tannerellaceae bacterium]|jgi:hypothetical protein|nr:hypothetical protein [Tannerellaceae bacterium]